MAELIAAYFKRTRGSEGSRLGDGLESIVARAMYILVFPATFTSMWPAIASISGDHSFARLIPLGPKRVGAVVRYVPKIA
jgi:hypothetical protein